MVSASLGGDTPWFRLARCRDRSSCALSRGAGEGARRRVRSPHFQPRPYRPARRCESVAPRFGPTNARWGRPTSRCGLGSESGAACGVGAEPTRWCVSLAPEEPCGPSSMVSPSLSRSSRTRPSAALVGGARAMGRRRQARVRGTRAGPPEHSSASALDSRAGSDQPRSLWWGCSRLGVLRRRSSSDLSARRRLPR